MPSTSQKQHNFMAAVAHSPSFAKKVGVPMSVGKDFNKADKGRKFKEGGETMAESKKAMEMRHAKTLGKIAKEEAKEAKEYKHGGKVKKMAMGGVPGAPVAMPAQSNAGGALRGLARAAAMSGRTMPTPGSARMNDVANVAEAMRRVPVRPIARTLPVTGAGMAKGGLAAGHKSADGIASKGKTKGMQVTMRRGGKC